MQLHRQQPNESDAGADFQHISPRNQLRRRQQGARQRLVEAVIAVATDRCAVHRCNHCFTEAISSTQKLESFVAAAVSLQAHLCCQPYTCAEAIARKAALGHRDCDALPVAVHTRLHTSVSFMPVG